MNGSFTLNIDLGDEAMQNAEDVIHALEGVIDALRWGREFGHVIDLNGNTVGKFALDVQDDEDDEDDEDEDE